MLRKVILDPYPSSNQHQTWINPRRSLTAYACHVWSISITDFEWVILQTMIITMLATPEARRQLACILVKICVWWRIKAIH